MNPLYLDMNVLEYLEYSACLHGLKDASAEKPVEGNDTTYAASQMYGIKISENYRKDFVSVWDLRKR